MTYYATLLLLINLTIVTLTVFFGLLNKQFKFLNTSFLKYELEMDFVALKSGTFHFIFLRFLLPETYMANWSKAAAATAQLMKEQGYNLYSGGRFSFNCPVSKANDPAYKNFHEWNGRKLLLWETFDLRHSSVSSADAPLVLSNCGGSQLAMHSLQIKHCVYLRNEFNSLQLPPVYSSRLHELCWYENSTLVSIFLVRPAKFLW